MADDNQPDQSAGSSGGTSGGTSGGQAGQKTGKPPKKPPQPIVPQPPYDKLDDLVAEADALALYISRHGDVLGDDGASLHTALLNAIKAARADGDDVAWVGLHEAYKAVTAITYPSLGVNGRTLLDTQEPSLALGKASFQNPRHRPVWVGLGLFVFALFIEFLTHWTGRFSDPTALGPVSGFFYAITISLATFLIPAAWGGIGACIFLMKRLSDKLFEMAYEKSRVRGDMTRVYLGAMLGVVVVVLIFPGFGESIRIGDVTFGPATAAFLAGLGVKPIYAAFESLSEELAKRFHGKKEGSIGES